MRATSLSSVSNRDFQPWHNFLFPQCSLETVEPRPQRTRRSEAEGISEITSSRFLVFQQKTPGPLDNPGAARALVVAERERERDLPINPSGWGPERNVIELEGNLEMPYYLAFSSLQTESILPSSLAGEGGFHVSGTQPSTRLIPLPRQQKAECQEQE